MSKEQKIQIPNGISVFFSNDLKEFTKNYIKKNNRVKAPIISLLQNLIHLIEPPGKMMLVNESFLICHLDLDGNSLKGTILKFEFEKSVKTTYKEMYAFSVEITKFNKNIYKYLETMKSEFIVDLEKSKKEYIEHANEQFKQLNELMEEFKNGW